MICNKAEWLVPLYAMKERGVSVQKTKDSSCQIWIFGVLRDAASHGRLAHHLLFVQLAIEFRPHHIAVRVLVRRDILQRLFLFDVNYCVIQRIIKNDVCCFSREEYRS